jgi:hypothetical protein
LRGGTASFETNNNKEIIILQTLKKVFQDYQVIICIKMGGDEKLKMFLFGLRTDEHLRSYTCLPAYVIQGANLSVRLATS